MCDKKRPLGFTLLELMLVVAIIGIIAATAIPAFYKYLVRSKTLEVFTNISKVYQGEVIYFTEEQVDRNGTILPREFIVAGPTPAVPPGRNKALGDWTVLNWPTIKFSPDSSVFFSYSVVASGVGSAARFTARAEGDLDADTIYSLYERIATVDSDGDVKGGAGIYQARPLE